MTRWKKFLGLGREKKQLEEEQEMCHDLDDLDMEDIRGGVQGSELSAKRRKKATPEDDWKACLGRMDRHCEKNWICIPSVEQDNNGELKLRVEIQELSTCSTEAFFIWLHKVYPAAKNLKHKPADYAKFESKLNAFLAIISIMKGMQFPKMDI